MRLLLGLNATLAFVLELALLATGVAVALLLPGPLPVRIVVAVMLPVAVIAIWGVWVAPRATRRLSPQGRLMTQIGLFAVAVVALAAVGQVVWAVALAVLVAVRVGLGVRLQQI